MRRADNEWGELITQRVRPIADSNRYSLFVFLLGLAVHIGMYWSLLGSGHVVYGDLSLVTSVSELPRSFVYLWRQFGQYATVTGQSHRLVYAPVLLFGTFVESQLSFEKVLFVYFVVLGAVSVVSMTWLCREVLSSSGYEPEWTLPVVAALCYATAPYVVEHVTHPSIKYAYALTPLFVLLVFRGVDRRSVLALVGAAFVWSLMVSAPHWVIFGGVFVGTYLGYHALYVSQRTTASLKDAISDTVQSSSIIGLPFALLNAYWLLPGVLAGGSGLYPNILTRDDIVEWYRNADPSLLLSQRANYLLRERYYPVPDWQVLDPAAATIVLTTIAVLALLRRQTGKHRLFLSAWFVVTFLLAAGPGLLGGAFQWLLFEAPMSGQFAWALRTPKIHFFITLSATPLLAIGGIELRDVAIQTFELDRQTAVTVITATLLVLSLYGSAPVATGNFNDNLETVELPPEYDSAAATLAEQNGSGYAIWGPPFGSRHKSPWSRNVVGNSLTVDLSPRPTVKASQSVQYPVFWNEVYGLPSLYNTGRYNRAGSALAPMNVRYVVLHDDIPSLSQDVDAMSARFERDSSMERISTDGAIQVWQVDPSVPHTRTAETTVAISGGPKRYSTFTRVNRANLTEMAPIFVTQHPSIVHRADTIVVGADATPIRVAGGATQSTYPFEYTDRNAPERVWSKGAIRSDQFYRALSDRGITNSFAYARRGIVYTAASGATMRYTPSGVDGEYDLYVRALDSSKGGSVGVQVGETQHTVETESSLEGVHWHRAGPVDVEAGDEVTLTNRGGFNAVTQIAFVPNASGQLRANASRRFSDTETVHLLEGESDFIGGDAVRRDSASNGGTVVLLDQTGARRTLDLLRDGEYSVVVRGSGTVDVELANETLQFEATETARRDIGSVSLAAGETQLRLTGNGTVDYVRLTAGGAARETSQPDTARVVTIEQADPTSYSGTVESEGPYTLVFAERYDPGWSVRVDGETAGVSQVPVAGAVNGFRINETGGHDIDIRYTPQRWSNVGTAVSAFSLVALGLVVAWRRKSFISGLRAGEPPAPVHVDSEIPYGTYLISLSVTAILMTALFRAFGLVGLPDILATAGVFTLAVGVAYRLWTILGQSDT